MSKIERITREKILGIKSYKSKREKIFNIGLRVLFFVFVIFLTTSLFFGFPFRIFEEKEVKASPSTYTFATCTQGTNCWAYYGKDAYGDVPVGVNRTTDWTVAGTEFSSAQYDNIETSNDVREQISETTNIRQIIHDFVMHINETPSTITSITLNWEGYAAIGSESAANNDLRMYLYNVNTAAWVLVDSELDNSCPGTTDCTMTFQITTITTPTIVNSIDGSGNLRFLVQKYEGACAGTAASCYPDASGTCTACSTCYTCSAGSCVAATTNYGDNLYGCTGADKKCDSGTCQTFCSGGYGANTTATISGSTVYCDNSNRMWTPTANIGGSATTYAWGGTGTDEPTNSCIGVADRPACNYCDNLTYAGYSDWQLPSCVSGAQNSNCILYQFGIDACGTYPCVPSWDLNAQSYIYWSSTEYNSYNAWNVDFNTGLVDYYGKDDDYSVRCVRGQ